MSHPTRRAWAPWAALLVLLMPGARAAAADYFLAVFAAQSTPYRPKFTHSFALAVRVDGEAFECHTISWLPQGMEIRPSKLRSDPGFNPDLLQTIGWAHSKGMCVSVWGPYRICPELYERFVALKERLDSGELKYHVASNGHPRKDAADCAHALEKLMTDRHRYIGPYGFGEPASAHLVESLSPWIVEPQCTHWWVAERVGLAGCDVIRREYGYRPTRKDSIRSALGK